MATAKKVVGTLVTEWLQTAFPHTLAHKSMTNTVRELKLFD